MNNLFIYFSPKICFLRTVLNNNSQISSYTASYSFQHKNPNQIHVIIWDFFTTPVTDIGIVIAAFIGRYFAF